MASSCCLFSSHPFLDPVTAVDMSSDGTQQLRALCPKSRESLSTPVSEVLALALLPGEGNALHNETPQSLFL